MSRPKVFLTGGDGFGWALDEYLRLTRLALEDTVEFAELPDADVVHSMWWRGVLAIPHRDLVGKRVVSYVSEEVFRFLAAPESIEAMRFVGRWIGRTTKEIRQFASVGIEAFHIPHLVDVGTFRPLGKAAAKVEECRRRWALPRDKYLIGSFQRDTEGSDLVSPKLVKGPDIILEVLRALWAKRLPIHVVLAGPRRFWLRRQLSDLGIPFTFLGQVVDHDDMTINTLPRSQLNVLYNLVDLYIVGSRSENAPDSVLEASAAGCKVVSTPVGVAPDVLESDCLYRTVLEAAALVEREIRDGWLVRTVEAHYQRVQSHHHAQAVAPLFRKLYEGLDVIPACGPRSDGSVFPPRRLSLVRRVVRRLGLTRTPSAPVVALWHRFRKPPYGGGNQFMMALHKALVRRGVRVIVNGVDDAQVHIAQAIWFDVERFLRQATKYRLKMIHRVDGPIHLIRGFDREKDEEVFRLNREFASVTVIQSAWSFQRVVEMGYQPVSPVIIHNAVDPDIFHRRGRIPFDRKRKIRLISTSWSDNPRKGGAVYKWIEKHLDWDRFEYTFVGRTAEQFERIRSIPPVPSEQLAEILRQHDIYITASQNDPCSNALVEALTCGLPALYLNDGGHPELVGYGGLPFTKESEILDQLDQLVENYEVFQGLISVPTLDEVADRYLTLIHELARQ